MKLVRTLVITLLFVIAVAIFMFQRRIDKDVREIVPDEVSRSFLMTPDEQIVRVEIRDLAKKSGAVLELEKAGWTLKEPIVYPADAMVVNGLVAALKIAAKRTRVRAEKDWNEYGLEKPDLEVTLVTNGKRKATLVFGAASPVGTAVYSRWMPERGYIFLPPEMKAIFRTSLAGLREKRIFRMPPENIREIFIEMGTHSYQWKKEKNEWYWFEPVSKLGKKIPEERIKLVLAALFSLYIKEFLGDLEKPEGELGFYGIHDRIRLKGDPGSEEVLHFGNEVPLANAYYGKKEDEGEMFFVDRVNVFRLLDVLRAVENENAKLPK